MSKVIENIKDLENNLFDSCHTESSRNDIKIII